MCFLVIVLFVLSAVNLLMMTMMIQICRMLYALVKRDDVYRAQEQSVLITDIDIGLKYMHKLKVKMYFPVSYQHQCFLIGYGYNVC